MKFIRFFVLSLALVVAASGSQSVRAQTYDKSYAKSLTLAGNSGSSTSSTVTLIAPSSLSSGYTLTLPGSLTGGGILSTDANGNLSLLTLGLGNLPIETGSTILGNPNALVGATTTILLGSGLGFNSGSLVNTGVTSITAGTGISISGSTGAVTITNSGLANAVNYNITAAQTTATSSGSNYLFNIGYTGTATGAPQGAVITSTNNVSAGASVAANSAVGLTINTTATGSGTTQGIPTGLAITISGDTSGPAIVLHNASSHITGDSVHDIITTSDDELEVQETGDLYGSSILRMQNRTGANGAIFQTISNGTHDSTDLVDWGFIPGNGVQSNIRLEDRHYWGSTSPVHAANEYLRASANITASVPEEFQYFFGTTTNPEYVFDIGPNATLLESGNFGIGYGTNSPGGDTAAGSPREKLDVHSPGSYFGGLHGASNIILSDSGTTTYTAPYVGSLKFQGSNDGISAFQAGAQGSNYVNYTLPTVATAPAANQVLTISSVSGSGTSASPYSAALTWSNGGIETFASAAANNNITSTTLTVDPSLQLPLAANATYEFSGVIAYDGAGTGGSTSSNLNIALHFATGTLTSIRWGANQPGTAVSPSSVTTDGTAVTTFHVDPVTATNDQSIFISGMIVVGATGGTLEVEEALNSASGNTEILSNSFIRATRVK